MSTDAVEPRDERAYTDFVRRCRPELLRFVRRLCGPACDHESIVQETLERAWRNWPDIRDPRPWAFRVAANIISNNSLSGKTEQPVAHIPSKFRWISTAAMPDLHLVVEALFIRDSIGDLSYRQRAAVYLFHVEGWRYKDIAQALGCSQSTVGVHIYRGTRAVRDTCAARHTPQDRSSNVGTEAGNKSRQRFERGSISARTPMIITAILALWFACSLLGVGSLAAVLIFGTLLSCSMLRIIRILHPRRSRSIGQRVIAQQEAFKGASCGQETLSR
jgi:RNA polymerase sigma factor (sigma-70 family)